MNTQNIKRRKMVTLSQIFLLSYFLLLSASTTAVRARRLASREGSGGIGGRRVLLSFRETPSGGNISFDCSPSGPCVRCDYSEKKVAKYRCAETGYRIPLKCVPTKNGATSKRKKETQNSRSAIEVGLADITQYLDDSLYNQRHLLGETSNSLEYTSYRSCVPPIGDEKLSVLGFEAVVLGLLLISSTVIYVRRKKAITMPGAVPGRIQMSRF